MRILEISYWLKIMQENIILIGYRATGKTSVSKILSEFLSFPVVSTDKVFVNKAGSIDEYVAVHGWDAFRNQESAILHQLHCEETIFDCGGGIIVKESNRKYLMKLGMIFWLQASVETIKERLRDHIIVLHLLRAILQLMKYHTN